MQTSTRDNPVRGKRSRLQFSLRSLLAGLTWLALILAICLNYQRAASRQRQQLKSLKSAGLLDSGRIGWQKLPPRTAVPAE